jgi:chemotaxis protein MotB
MKSTRNVRKIIFMLILILSVSSCVPLQKYHETENSLKSANQEIDNLTQQIEQLKVENAEMKQQIKRYDDRLSALVKDSMQRVVDYQNLSRDYDNVSSQLSELQETHELLLKGAEKESTKLLKQLRATQDELKKKEESLTKLEKSLNEKKKNLEIMTMELNKRDARLKELENILFKKDSVVRTLKNTVSTALLGFENEGLSVNIRNGKVYVSLEEKLLFPSGSAVVDPRGKDALKKLAKVLEQNPDINITIEGHTDNVPYKSKGEIKDNWDLSVMRATSIIRILLENSNINPSRLTASGKGEFSPVASNKTAEGRAKNRRTEIILTPKLDELFKILE